MADDRLPTIYPTLRYQDAPGAIRFLTETFGFTEKSVTADDDGRIAHAELSWGDGGMVMLASGAPTPARRGPFELGPVCVYLVTDDPDGLFKRAEAAGAEIVMRLTDQDYGSREFAARDAEGNVWCFGTYQPAAS